MTSPKATSVADNSGKQNPPHDLMESVRAALLAEMGWEDGGGVSLLAGAIIGRIYEDGFVVVKR